MSVRSKLVLSMVAGALALAGSIGTTHAAIYEVTALDNATGFGHEPAKPAPSVTAEGFHASGLTGDYTSIQIKPSAIGMTGLTLGQIASLAYDTKQVGGAIDWQIKVYTVDQNGSAPGWYGVRLKYGMNDGTVHTDWETYSRDNDTYNNWITIGGPNPLTTYLKQNQPTQYASALAAALDQEVFYFELSLGASDGGQDFDSFVNNIVITPTLSSGFEAATIRTPTTAAVPEPGTFAILGVAGVALLRRKRKTT